MAGLQDAPFIASAQDTLINCNEPAMKISVTGNSIAIVDNTVTVTGTWNPSSTNNNTKVIISGNVELNGKTDCYSLTFAPEAHLTINSGARLRVWEGGITNNDCETVNYLTLKVDGINNTYGQFLLHPTVSSNCHPKTAVQLYSKGCKSGQEWQRFGVPSYNSSITRGDNVNLVYTTPSQFQQVIGQDWVVMNNNDNFVPFRCCNVTSTATTPDTVYTFKCGLVGNMDVTLNLSTEWNYYANSYTAPIDTLSLIIALQGRRLLIFNTDGNFVEQTINNITIPKILPIAGAFTIQRLDSNDIEIMFDYETLVWDPSFKPEITPTRSGAKGGSSLPKSEIPDEPAFKDPESPIEFGDGKPVEK